jgi:trk system potassium uptake protein TrkH
MNFRTILNILSKILLFVSCFMALPVVVSLFYDRSDTLQLAVSCLITGATGAILHLLTRRYRKADISHRDAFVVVTLAWVLMSSFASVPYLLTGTFASFTDAYFESMSGFTTTGASVLTDVEVVPRGVMFWRCLTQWIGGMGIIVLALAVLPMIGSGGMQLFKAEVPEISVDKLRPRILDTAKALWIIYVGITAMNIATLLIGGMDLFDAACHAFTTMATGGFSTKNASIAHYKSPFLEYACTFFMFVAGGNFSLYFYLIRGNVGRLWRNEEFRFYVTTTLMATLLIALNLWGSSVYDSFTDSFRYSIFQVVTIMTTTGYFSDDFEKWTPFGQVALVLVMFLGGMIGSTGGGIKQVRVLLMLKQGYREMYQLIHPRAVTSVKLDEKFLTKDILGSIWGFVFLFISVTIIATAGMTALGVDLVTSATAVISAICNVGPALGEAGPTENYAALPASGKWILTFCMLTGRLEVYTVLILFLPQFWKK